MIYTVEAIDEFGRVYHNTRALTGTEQFDHNPNWILVYYMELMVREILIQMGEDAWATWVCIVEEWGWWE